MKLSVKIFFSICISAVAASLLVLGLILNKTYEANIKKENERSIEEFHIIKNNMQTNIDQNENVPTNEIVKIYADYYVSSGIYFIYLDNSQIMYSSFKDLNEYVTGELLENEKNTYLSKVIQIEGKQYILISTKLNIENQELIYAREITEIYEIQEEIKQYGYFIIAVSLFAIAILSYVISKSLTSPLENIQKGTKKIASGDYKVILKEDRSEFGKLAKSFNKMTKDIDERNQKLVELVENKQMFIDNLSHEMNTPLTTINGYAEFLERANCSREDQIKYLQYIQEESKRIRDIYKKLLLLSYKREKDIEIKQENFNQILEKVNQSVSGKLNEKNIELIIINNINILTCDKTLVQIAISNLIKNAANASEENSRIIVNGYDTKEGKVVEVIDYGVGISSDNIQKILEPFYRVDKARSREEGGAGLRIINMQKYNGNA